MIDVERFATLVDDVRSPGSYTYRDSGGAWDEGLACRVDVWLRSRGGRTRDD